MAPDGTWDALGSLKNMARSMRSFSDIDILILRLVFLFLLFGASLDNCCLTILDQK